jgi:hypothetical protein
MKGLARNTPQVLSSTISGKINIFREAHSASVQCSPPIENTGGCSPRYLVSPCRPAVARLCASLTIRPS